MLVTIADYLETLITLTMGTLRREKVLTAGKSFQACSTGVGRSIR